MLMVLTRLARAAKTQVTVQEREGASEPERSSLLSMVYWTVVGRRLVSKSLSKHRRVASNFLLKTPHNKGFNLFYAESRFLALWALTPYADDV